MQKNTFFKHETNYFETKTNKHTMQYPYKHYREDLVCHGRWKLNPAVELNNRFRYKMAAARPPAPYLG